MHAAPGSAAQSCQGCHQQAATDFWRGPHGVALNRGEKGVPTCVSCHGSHGVKSPRDPSAPTWPGRAAMTCGTCHPQAADEFGPSVHGRVLAAGQVAVAPSCSTCHGAHTAAPVRREQEAATCGTCHIAAQLAFTRSVHGTAVRRGVLHAPTCTGCHGIHAVPAAAVPTSPTAAVRVAEATCARCHASVRITQMHNLPTQVVEDFWGSFHGLAAAAGDRWVANCASCHGYHEIRPSSDPLSSIHPVNLGRTCGQCHPGAGERFAQGGVHHIPTTWGHRLVDTVRTMYTGMIAVVIGLMAVHNGLDFQRRWRDRRRRAHPPEGTAGPVSLRFTVNERLQHWLTAASFGTLVFTGFALRLGWRLPWVAEEMQQPTRAAIHRGTATLLMGLAVYHLGYLVLTARGRAMARAILPRLQSAADLVCCGGACLRLGPPSVSDWR
jgi:predicted CxxxxCH...CXXCH cytochrome family protein